ncbi:MAG: PCRF domain-containing protein, partial [Vicinamibacterales bacterium]
MFDKLATIEQQYEDLLHRLGSTELQSDPAESRKQAKALSDIEPTVQRYREYKSVLRGIAETEELVAASDTDMR